MGPAPRLTRPPPSRHQAVREAVQRAREYAEALGTSLAALVELADLGAENAQPSASAPQAARAMRTMAFDAGAADAAPALDLEPQRQTVYAQVNARFTMTRRTLRTGTTRRPEMLIGAPPRTIQHLSTAFHAKVVEQSCRTNSLPTGKA